LRLGHPQCGERVLERDGLVTRTIYPTIPPRVEYELTALGTTLIEPIGALFKWASKHRATIEKARAVFDARQAKPEPALARRA